MSAIAGLRGMPDVLPLAALRFEAIKSISKSVASRFGYQEVCHSWHLLNFNTMSMMQLNDDFAADCHADPRNDRAVQEERRGLQRHCVQGANVTVLIAARRYM